MYLGGDGGVPGWCWGVPGVYLGGVGGVYTWVCWGYTWVVLGVYLGGVGVHLGRPVESQVGARGRTPTGAPLTLYRFRPI